MSLDVTAYCTAVGDVEEDKSKKETKIVGNKFIQRAFWDVFFQKPPTNFILYWSCGIKPRASTQMLIRRLCH
ncbi:hypothetical protein BTE48_13325 [Oceanospirillum multiglobuliferum]|uniref:Uncharacterized protein n=1 Tax=Oceanospirillum multiglobuliferum TaxID=64969 RepID=A0A1V4T3A1_9GAMM|nr:hypothetical protein BTE48_13325 [Oceanospirillum multiglobuliferum]